MLTEYVKCISKQRKTTKDQNILIAKTPVQFLLKIHIKTMGGRLACIILITVVTSELCEIANEVVGCEISLGLCYFFPPVYLMTV